MMSDAKSQVTSKVDYPIENKIKGRSVSCDLSLNFC